jgi:hypothetical protein
VLIGIGTFFLFLAGAAAGNQQQLPLRSSLPRSDAGEVVTAEDAERAEGEGSGEARGLQTEVEPQIRTNGR